MLVVELVLLEPGKLARSEAAVEMAVEDEVGAALMSEDKDAIPVEFVLLPLCCVELLPP
jgi:hypothetical protein